MRVICLVMLLLVCANAKAISLTRVGQPGLYRVVRVVTPQSGAWAGRLTGFEW